MKIPLKYFHTPSEKLRENLKHTSKTANFNFSWIIQVQMKNLHRRIEIHYFQADTMKLKIKNSRNIFSIFRDGNDLISIRVLQIERVEFSKFLHFLDISHLGKTSNRRNKQLKKTYLIFPMKFHSERYEDMNSKLKLLLRALKAL